MIIYGFIPWDDVWNTIFDADFPLPTFGNFYFTEAIVLFIVAAVVIGVDRQLGEEGTVNTIVAGAVRLPRRRRWSSSSPAASRSS